MTQIHMVCEQCRTAVVLHDRPGLTAAFCSPGHCVQWQDARTEAQIQHYLWNGGRCQWCGCRLHTGYHEPGCPCRAVERNET